MTFSTFRQVLAVCFLLSPAALQAYVVEWKWADNTLITFHTNLPSKTIGGKSYRAIFEKAAEQWNAYLGAVKIQVIRDGAKEPAGHNSLNEVGWSPKSFDGRPWQGAAGITEIEGSSMDGNIYYPIWPIAETDILFNATVDWTYETFMGACLHEIGHALGLGHPFEQKQKVISVMNYENEYQICYDDAQGIQSIYGNVGQRGYSAAAKSTFSLVVVTGTAQPGTKVTVKFGTSRARAKASATGGWVVTGLAKKKRVLITFLFPDGAIAKTKVRVVKKPINFR